MATHHHKRPPEPSAHTHTRARTRAARARDRAIGGHNADDRGSWSSGQDIYIYYVLLSVSCLAVPKHQKFDWHPSAPSLPLYSLDSGAPTGREGLNAARRARTAARGAAPWSLSRRLPLVRSQPRLEKAATHELCVSTGGGRIRLSAAAACIGAACHRHWLQEQVAARLAGTGAGGRGGSRATAAGGGGGGGRAASSNHAVLGPPRRTMHHPRRLPVLRSGPAARA